MNKIVVLIMLLTAASNALSSQGRWEPCRIPYDDSIAVLSANESAIYAGSDYSVYRSGDAGDRWKMAKIDLMYPVESIVATGGDTVFVVERAGLHCSVDRGGSFEKVLSIADLRSLLCGEEHLFVLRNMKMMVGKRDGSRWSASPDSGVADSNFTALAVHKKKVLAGTGRNGVYVSDDAGIHWTAANSGLAADTNGVYPKIAYLFAGENRFYLWSDSGFFSAERENLIWQHDSNLMDSIIPRCVIANGEIMLAGCDDGILRSSDGGASWSLMTDGLPAHRKTGKRTVYGLTMSGTKIVAGTVRGVYISNDGGLHWSAANTHSTITSFTKMGRYLFAGTHQGIYRSEDNGTSWARPDSTPFNINALTVNDSFVIAGCGKGGWMTGTVSISPDSGITWIHPSRLDTFPGKVVALCVLPGRVFAGIDGYEGVEISRNNGRGFSRCNEGLVHRVISSYNVNTSYMTTLDTTLYVATSDGFFTSDTGGLLWEHCDSGISGEVTSFAALGTTQFTATESGIFRSDDKGKFWYPVGNLENVHSLIAQGSYLFVGTADGVFFSGDSGVQWLRLGDGMDGNEVRALFVDNNMLFAAALGGGVYRLTLEGSVAAVVPEEIGASADDFSMAFQHGFLSVSLMLQKPEAVTLSLFDLSGRLRKVAKVQNLGIKSAVSLDVRNCSPGYYLLQITTSKFRECRKIMVR